MRSSIDAAELLATLRRLVADVEPGAPMQNARTLREAMGFSLVPAKIAHGVFTIAGVIGLLLAVGGLYGLGCYTLARRLREIGIRVALGAGRRQVFRFIVGGAVRLTVIGVVLGVGLAAAGTRVLSVFLHGLSPTDALTLAGICDPRPSREAMRTSRTSLDVN